MSDLINHIRLYLEQTVDPEEDQAVFLVGYILNSAEADEKFRQQIGRELLEKTFLSTYREQMILTENQVREVCQLEEDNEKG